MYVNMVNSELEKKQYYKVMFGLKKKEERKRVEWGGREKK